MEHANEDTSYLESVPMPSSLEERMKGRIDKGMTEPNPWIRWPIVAAVTAIVLFTISYMLWDDTIIYETASGEIKEVTLADGTKVTLNNESVLEVPKEFDATTRNVTLNGEAYFEVAKDTNRPFTITADSTKTTVLGTAFNLSAYEQEPNTLVLIEGKVSISSIGSRTDYSIIMQPNEQVVMQNKMLNKTMVDPDYAKAWMQKKLDFQSVPLQYVFQEIGRFYGVKFMIEKPGLKQRIYRGSHENITLQELLKSMAFIYKFKIKQDGENLIIY